MALPPINITITGDNSDFKQKIQEVTTETRTAAEAARAHANELKASAETAKRAYDEAARGARDAGTAGKEAAKQAANALKDEADAARDAAKAADQNARALENTHAEKVRETARALKEQQQAANAARQANEENARAIEQSSARLRQAGMMAPGGGAMAAMMGGGAGMRSQMGDMRAAQKNLAMAGDGGPMGVDVGLLDKASNSAQQLTQNLGGVRNAGLGIAAVGVGGLRVSNELSQISAQAENAKASMESLLKQQGRGGDTGQVESVVANIAVQAHLANKDEARQQVVSMLSDEVKTADIPQLLESVVRNAQTLKKPMNEVGEAFSKAYTEGALTRLKRCNILFSQQEEDSVKAAFGISKAAGQIEFMRVVTAATERDTNKLGESLSDVQKQTNDNARAFNDFAVATGEGTQQADANVKGIGAGLARMVSYNPSLAKGAGELLTYGSYAATAVGGVVAFGAQLAQLFVAYTALKLARDADTISTGGNTVAQTADTVATGAKTGATVADTVATTASTGAEAADTTATTVNTVATTANTVAEEANAAATLENAGAKEALAIAEDAAAEGAGAEAIGAGAAAIATGTAGAAAAGAAIGFGAMAVAAWLALWPILAIGAAVLGLVAAVYKLSGAWDAENEAAKNAAQSSAADKEFFDKQTARRAQGKTSDVGAGETYEQWKKRKGRGDENSETDGTPPSTSTSGTPDFDKMKADAQAQQSAAPVAPARPPVAAPVAVPVAVPVTAPASVAPNAPVPSGETGNGASRLRALQDERDPNADQITALMREKRDLKGKSNVGKRDDLQKQIDAMHDGSRAWKEHHGEAMRNARAEASADRKAARDNLRAQKTRERDAKREQKEEDGSTLMVQKARIANAREDQIADLEDKLDGAKDAKNVAQVRALTLQIEKVKAEQSYDEKMAAAALEHDAGRRQAMEEVARVDLQHDERKGERSADKAAHSMNKSDAKQHDARIRAELAMMGTGVGFSRFDALPVVTAAPIRADLNSPFASAPPITIPPAPASYPMDTGGMMDSTRGGAALSRLIPAPQLSLDAQGNVEFQFESFKLPVRDLGLSIGSRRGKVKR